MHREAWCAAVHGVAKTQTRLNNERGPQVVRKERIDRGVGTEGPFVPHPLLTRMGHVAHTLVLFLKRPSSTQAEDSQETAGLPGTFAEPALTWRTASSSVGLPDLSQGSLLLPLLSYHRLTFCLDVCSFHHLNILVLCRWCSKIHLGSIPGEACSFTKCNLHIQFKLVVPCCVFHFRPH